MDRETRDMLLDTADRFFTERCGKDIVNSVEKGVWPADFWKEIEEMGLPLIAVAEDKGGAGGTLADMLALLHGSVFGYSGANPAALPPIRAHGNTVLIAYDDMPAYFHRSSARPAPHNVYSDTKTVLNAGLARRKNLTAPKPLFTYGDAPASAPAATNATMSWPEASAGWRWNGTTWLRTQNGTPDVMTDGSRVKADNVVIMQIRIGSTGIRDVAGNASPLDITTGSGKVWILRDGKMVVGTWKRPGIGSKLRFVNAAGAPLTLHTGRTWIELLPRPRVPKIT